MDTNHKPVLPTCSSPLKSGTFTPWPAQNQMNQSPASQVRATCRICRSTKDLVGKLGSPIPASGKILKGWDCKGIVQQRWYESLYDIVECVTVYMSTRIHVWALFMYFTLFHTMRIYTSIHLTYPTDTQIWSPPCPPQSRFLVSNDGDVIYPCSTRHAVHGPCIFGAGQLRCRGILIVQRND